MAQQLNMNCPDCGAALVVKGKRKPVGSVVFLQELLVCCGCGYEEWRKLQWPHSEKVN